MIYQMEKLKTKIFNDQFDFIFCTKMIEKDSVLNGHK